MICLLSRIVLIIMNEFWIINISKRFVPRGNILTLCFLLTLYE